MIDSYLNHTAIWRKKIDVNDFNEPMFAPDQTISCRVDYKRKMVRNKEGQEVVSEGTIICSVKIKADDVIVYGEDEMILMTGRPWDDLFGSTLFYEGVF